ncbi:VOC family protein [Roseibium salinum]|uniref:VOC family protein n=1 Tax=Roseibium salinum TaxID=1604349 RepID=A0ABT3R595_9HYPH|nr:VOC family protein [Roseibium sp. DSM 29163]MCX2724369.1 VOC family protein [Roseibium sp. DSM 29163]MDN3721594.1 VOC family protein [Roseibium salinum]
MVEHGIFHWNELMTRDVEKARTFYGQSLGWTFTEMPMETGTYVLANLGDKPVGGLFPMTGPEFEGVPEHWMSYIAVDDVDKRLKLARAHGGEIVREPFDVPGIGRIAILKDAGGAVQGWMTPVEMTDASGQ